MESFSIPKEIRSVVLSLEGAGFEAYLVGGSVRDLLRGVEPKDWDVATNATPEEIIKIFPETFYENDYGTVGVVTCGEKLGVECKDERLKVVEVTPYRLEEKYSDSRHPDKVTFTTSLKDDLKRRDFTMNAVAYSVSKEEVFDPFCGQKDIEGKVIRAVGEAQDRLNEDALRMLRAIRFSAELSYELDKDLAVAIKKLAKNLEKISKERIRDEFVKIILSPNPMRAIVHSKELGLLAHIAPEIERGIGVMQNQAHKYDVWEHNLRTLQHSADKEWPLLIRMSALFHDVSKPETRRFSKEKNDYTFYGHDVVGARVTKNILERLKFPNQFIEDVTMLVRWHMFFSDPEAITLSAVRRLIARVGKEHIWELMDLRVCDRVGTGRPKENPYRFRKYKSMVEEAMRDPINVGMLKVNGADIMKLTGEKPGPRIGFILHALLEEVFEKPELNERAYFEKRVKELSTLSDSELKKLGEKGKEFREKAEEEELGKIRGKYFVK